MLHGIITRLPVDPLGGQYELNSLTGAVSASLNTRTPSNSREGRVPIGRGAGSMELRCRPCSEDGERRGRYRHRKLDQSYASGWPGDLRSWLWMDCFTVFRGEIFGFPWAEWAGEPPR